MEEENLIEELLIDFKNPVYLDVYGINIIILNITGFMKLVSYQPVNFIIDKLSKISYNGL